MRGIRHHLVPERPIGTAGALKLCQIPGVRLTQGKLVVPGHALPIVDRAFTEQGIRYRSTKVVKGRQAKVLPFGDDPFESLERVSEEARAKATPYQRAGLARFLRSGGGIAAWSCGSGKTLLGVAFAAGHQGRTLVICPAGSVPQWATELRRWSTLSVHPETTGTAYELRRRSPRPVRTVRLVHREPLRERARGGDEVALRLLYLLPELNEVAVALGGGWVRRDFFTDEEWTVVKKGLKDGTFEAGEEAGTVLFEIVGERGVVGVFTDEAEAEEERERLNRGRPLPADVDVVVVGWSLVTARLEALLAWAPDVVVIDECHRAKDHKRWTATEAPDGTVQYTRLPTTSASAQAVCQQAGAVLLLTATPQPDRTRDWWGQLDLLDPFGFGTFHAFSARHCNGHQGEHGWKSEGSSNEDELKERIAPFLHHVTRAEAAKYLPPLRRNIVTLSLSQLVAAKADKDVMRELGAFGKGVQGRVQAEIALAAEQKRGWIANRTTALLKEKAKVVVFTILRTSCDRLGRAIAKANPEVKVWVGHGGESIEDRRAMLLEYAAHPGPCCLVGTIASWGESLDGLQHTDYGIIGGLTWNHGQLEQMEGRFSRHGGRNVVLEYPIAGGTIDEIILRRVLAKLDDALVMLPNAELERMRADLLQEGKEDELLDEMVRALAEHEETFAFGDGGDGNEVRRT